MMAWNEWMIEWMLDICCQVVFKCVLDAFGGGFPSVSLFLYILFLNVPGTNSFASNRVCLGRNPRRSVGSCLCKGQLQGRGAWATSHPWAAAILCALQWNDCAVNEVRRAYSVSIPTAHSPLSPPQSTPLRVNE